MLSQFIPPLRNIITSFFTIEELTLYAEELGKYSDGDILFNAIFVTIKEHLEKLKGIRKTCEPDESPHIRLKNIFLAQQRKKAMLLATREVSDQEREVLQRADPDPHHHSVEDVLAPSDRNLLNLRLFISRTVTRMKIIQLLIH